MAKTTTIRVRLKDQNHPTHSRRRGGIVVTNDVQEFEVTPEQLDIIKSDPYIQILKPSNQKVTEVDEDDDDGDDEKETKAPVAKSLSKMPKAELVTILIEELKQQPEVDFNPDASNDALRGIIETLRAKSEEKDDDGDDEEKGDE